MKLHPLDSQPDSRLDAGPLQASALQPSFPAAVKGEVRRLLIFCGSRCGDDPRHAATASAVGTLLASRRVSLVYGGGALGLMGVAGRAALAAGGTAEGVIPRFLKDWEVAEPLCEDMTVVDSLHTRKAVMFERADAVLALPGGLGTLDELVEIMSWRNLRLHAKPVWLLGDGGYWEPFLALIAHLVREGFGRDDILGAIEHLPGLDALAARLPAA